MAILPEPVGQWFSRPRPQVLQVSPRKVNHDGNKMNTADGMFCYCKRGEDEDDMVACDNENCNTEWLVQKNP